MDDGNDLITDERLEELYQQGLKKLQSEKEQFIPRRREEIAKLKQEMESTDAWAGCKSSEKEAI